MSVIREGYPMYCTHFPGGDPRRFKPDEQCATPAEMEAWKAACERAEAGEVEQESSAYHEHGEGWAVMGHVVMFGPGTYWYEEDWMGDEDDDAPEDWDREVET